MAALQSKDCRDGAATNSGLTMSESPQKAAQNAGSLLDRKLLAKAEAEINRLKKLEMKADQRLLCHKRRFFAADWHRKRCEQGSEREAHWAGVAQSALSGWLMSADQLLAIAARRCLAEQKLTRRRK